MKFLTNKKLIQKITIVMVFLILFNFIVPNYSRAGILDTVGEAMVTGIDYLLLFLGDSVITILQQIFIGTDPIDKEADNDEDKYQIAMSPGKIFSGVVYALNIDFISKKDINEEETKTSTETNTENIADEKWYKNYEDSIEKLDKKLDSYHKDPGSDKDCAANIISSSIKATSNEDIIKKIDSIINSMEKYSGEDALYEAVKENTGFKYEIYIDDSTYNTTEEGIDEKAKKLLDNIKFEKVIKEYTKYRLKNDPGFKEAAMEKYAPAYMLHDVIATWYKIMRNIALVFLLSILVYIGIRIMLSTTAADSSKYKKMLMDWVVAICILFVLHYIMAFAINFTELITSAFAGKDVSATTPDSLMNIIRGKAGAFGIDGIGYVILYLVLITYTIIFLWYYVKRVVYIAFLTIIAPLVALTYPLDKMGDSKAQAFEMWLREFILNTIIQPVHLIIYTVMVTSSIALAEVNPIYAIVVMGSMIPAEKFVKEMFGLESPKGPKGGFAAGALTMSALQSLSKKQPPKFGHDVNAKGGTNSSSESKEKIKKPRMDGEKSAELSKSITGGAKEDSNVKTANPTTSTEDKQDIDNGDFKDSRTPPQEETRKQETGLPSGQEGGNLGSEDGIVPEEITRDGIEAPQGEKEEPSEQVRTHREESKPQPSAEEQTQSQNSKDITSVRIGPLASRGKDASSTKKASKKKDIKGPKKKSALKATAGHYVRKAVSGKNLRKLGRGVVRSGLGLAAGAVGAGIGLATGIASGDLGQALKNTALGATAGRTIGRNVGDGISNFAGGAVDLGKGIRDTYREQRDEINKYDLDAQKAQLKKENKKYSTSAEAKAAIKTRYGSLHGKDLKEKEAVIERYRNAGVEDFDTIFNAYNLEQGKDAFGNDIGTKLSQDHAMYIAQMASKMDDSAASRKSVENSMQNQFAQNYEANGMDTAKAIEQAKADRKREMQYIDMAKGKTGAEADIAAKQAELQKAYEDSKEEKAARQQAQFNAEAQRSTNTTTNNTSS